MIEREVKRSEITSRKLVWAHVENYTKLSLKHKLMHRNALNAGGSNSMKDWNWKNISNETSWIWRTINTMIQKARLIGKESKNIVLKYIRVNLILNRFFRLKIFQGRGGKNFPSPCCLENRSLSIHATWQRYSFHLFVNFFPEKKLSVELLSCHWCCGSL